MAPNSPRRSARASKKARYYADPDADPEDAQHSPAASSFAGDDDGSDAFAEPAPVAETPSRPPKTPRRTPVKKKVEDADSSYNGPDLEVINITGTVATTKRMQSRGTKTRTTRAEWALGLYEPPDLALASTSGTNEDESFQSQDFASTLGLPWPKDGLVQTRLDSSAFANLKKDRYKYWCAQTGWVPNENLFDISWWPGKAIGYKASQERTDWVQQQHRSTENKVGWPFTSPTLDLTPDTIHLLSPAEADRYLQGTATSSAPSPNVALQHPTTVTKFAVAQPAATKKGKGKANGAQDDHDSAIEDEADAEEDHSAKHETIDANDPKFADIANIGMQEPLPVTGPSLELAVGPPGQEQSVTISRGTAVRLDSVGLEGDHGHILNAGGHVYDLGWAPVPIHLNHGKEYFAISAASTVLPRSYIGQKSKTPQPGSIQIWSLSPDAEQKGQAQLEMVLCHDLGTAYKLSWCPLGHSYLPPQQQGAGAKTAVRRLGLLAGCFEDGSTSIISVPYPGELAASGKGGTTDPVMLKLEPVLQLTIPCSASNCLSWAGGELLAVGTSDGHVVVWDVGTHLRSAAPPAHLVPRSYTRVHRAAISSLNWILLPPITASGVGKLCMNPTQIFTVSMDGWTCVVDLLDPTSSASLERSRSVHYASEFVPHAGGVLAHENGDGSVAFYSLRAEEMYRARVVSHTPARVLALSSSSFHPMLAAGTAHGEVKSCNVLRSTKRSGKQHTQRIHLPIYQLRLDRTSGKLTIAHRLTPQMANTFEHKSWKVATWNSVLNITALQWSPNFGRANLLLSGSASGMVKIDCVTSPFN